MQDVTMHSIQRGSEPGPWLLSHSANDTILQLACWLAPAKTHWEWQGANDKVGQCCMSCSLVNINHLVFSMPAYVPSSAKRNCLVESKTEEDSGHRCVSLFPSMSENQDCKKNKKKKNRVTKTLIVHNLYLMSSFETKWPVCNVLSLMTQLVFHARGDSNDTLNTHSNKKCVEILRGWLRNWLNMQLKGDSNLVRLLYFPVLSLFFITALFITSLPVPSESICGQSLGKENASIWFLRLYNL